MKTCKKCFQEKPFEEFYSHAWMTDWILSTCKECVKAIRRTPEARSAARISDKKRNSTQKRKQMKKQMLQNFRLKNPEKWKAQCAVNNFLRYHKEMKKTCCSVCGKTALIHYHHFDYSKPNQVIPCCAFDHSKFHHWKTEVNPEWILTLPF